VLRGGKKKEKKKTTAWYQSLLRQGADTREGRELSATRDVISANEIANRVNWK